MTEVIKDVAENVYDNEAREKSRLTAFITLIKKQPLGAAGAAIVIAMIFMAVFAEFPG